MNAPIEVTDEIVKRGMRALVLIPDDRVTLAWGSGVGIALAPLSEYPEDEQKGIEHTVRVLLEFALNGTFSLKCPHGDEDVTFDSPEEATAHMQRHVDDAHAALNDGRCCSRCGCSEINACVTTDGSCSWVEGRAECSACLLPETRIRGPLKIIAESSASGDSSPTSTQILIP